MFENAEVIYSYTREQAIDDGYQVKLENDLADLGKEAGYKYPIYLTSGVWGLIDMAVKNKRHCNDLKGVLWDILYMSRTTGRMLNDRLKKFQVIITGTGNQKYHTMYIECGATDFEDPAPALTIMLPEEN